MAKRQKEPFDDWRDELLGQVWAACDDLWQWSLSELAAEADLARTTVYNLYNEVTKEPRLHTVYKLAAAVGMDIKMIEKAKRKWRKAG